MCLFGFLLIRFSFFLFVKLQTAWRACTKLTHIPLHHIRIKTFFCVCFVAAHKRRNENEFLFILKRTGKNVKIPTLFQECPNFDLFDCSWVFIPFWMHLWNCSAFAYISVIYYANPWKTAAVYWFSFQYFIITALTAWLWIIDCMTFLIFHGAEYSISNGIHFLWTNCIYSQLLLTQVLPSAELTTCD